MSENDQGKNQALAELGDGAAGGDDERKGPKMKLTGVQAVKGKRGRKPKAQKENEDDDSEEEFNPEKEGHDEDEEDPHPHNKSEVDDEDYGGSDEDYDGKKNQKKRGRKSLKKTTSIDTPRSGAKRGRKPKNKNVEEKQDNGTNADDQGSAQKHSEDGDNQTGGTSEKGKRVTRTSSGRLPSHHDTYQPTFKKYKPLKKEGDNNEDGSGSQNNGANGNKDPNQAGDDINVKRPYQAIDGTANLTTQAELPENQIEKKIKTSDA